MNLISATYNGNASYDLRLFVCRKSGREIEAEIPVVDTEIIKPKLASIPTLVVVSGYGVITKTEASAPEIAEKITAPDSGFLWNRRQEQLSFVREEQLSGLLANLSQAGARVLDICCVQDNPSGESVREYVRDYYAASINLCNLFEISPRGSILAGTVASRIKMPVLGCILLLLAANAMITPRLNKKTSRLRSETLQLQKQIGAATESDNNRRQLVAGFNTTLPHSFGWLCDRAAGVLPAEVRLTSLSVQPLTKSLDEGKKPELSLREIVITGESPQPQSVTRYVSELDSVAGPGSAKLSAMEYDKDKRLLNFRINISL